MHHVVKQNSSSQAGCYAVRPHDAFVQIDHGWQACTSGNGKHGREPMTAAVASILLLTSLSGMQLSPLTASLCVIAKCPESPFTVPFDVVAVLFKIHWMPF